jgi:hypothetical protein
MATPAQIAARRRNASRSRRQSAGARNPGFCRRNPNLAVAPPLKHLTSPAHLRFADTDGLREKPRKPVENRQKPLRYARIPAKNERRASFDSALRAAQDEVHL